MAQQPQVDTLNTGPAYPWGSDTPLEGPAENKDKVKTSGPTYGRNAQPNSAQIGGQNAMFQTMGGVPAGVVENIGAKTTP